jgi:hypothetical protein
MFKHALSVVALLFVAGCVTPYGPHGIMGGYVDREVSPGVYRVEVTGNAYTRRSVLEAYFMRRIKEVCAERGKVVAAWEIQSDSETEPESYTIRSSGRDEAKVTRDPTVTRWSVWGHVLCKPPPER